VCVCVCLQVLPASIDYTAYKQPLTTSISSASLKPRGVQFCNAMHFGKMGVSAGSFLNATLQTWKRPWVQPMKFFTWWGGAHRLRRTSALAQLKTCSVTSRLENCWNMLEPLWKGWLHQGILAAKPSGNWAKLRSIESRGSPAVGWHPRNSRWSSFPRPAVLLKLRYYLDFRIFRPRCKLTYGS
jgi:hypothetical protein